MQEELRATKINSRYIPSLDGLRAVSIFLVVISHISIGIYHVYGANFSPTQCIGLTLFFVGHLCVLVFFIISGFLITTLIIKDEKFSLRRFYIRRVLRIIPPYYFYILVIFILGVCGIFVLSFQNIFSALLFIKNYYYDDAVADSWNFAHTWSLSVEEQFYILIPITLVLMGKMKGRYAIICIIIICPILRFLYILNNTDSSVELSPFHLVADSLAMGCLLALYRNELHVKNWYKAILNCPLINVIPVVVLIITWLGRFPAYMPKGIYVLMFIAVQNLLIALFIDRVITVKTGFVYRALNLKWVGFFGKISYSIYLWQQLFLNPDLKIPIPLKVLFFLAAAVFSYYIIEIPSQRLKQKLEAKWKKSLS